MGGISHFYYAKHGTSEWTEFTDQWTCVNQIMGLYALKKEALATLEAIGANVCIKATASEGRICYTPLISARELNEPVQALQALDTCSMPLMVVESATPVWAYYGLLTHPTNGAGWTTIPASWDDIIPLLGENYDPVVHISGTHGAYAEGFARWGHPIQAHGQTWYHYSDLDLIETWEVDWHEHDGAIRTGYHADASSDSDANYYISGQLAHGELTYSVEYKQAMDLLFSSLMKMLPDGCVIEDAWADVTASAGRIQKSIHHVLLTEGYMISALDPTKYQLYVGRVLGVEGLAVAWDEDDNPTETVQELFGITDFVTDEYDSETAEDPAMVSVSMVGVRKNDGSILPFGKSSEFACDGEAHRVQIRDIAQAMYAQRNNGFDIGLTITLPDQPIIPAVSHVGTCTIPKSPGQEDNGPLQRVLVHYLRYPVVGVTSPSVGISNAVIKFTLNGVASTIMCGGGVPHPLPAMG